MTPDEYCREKAAPAGSTLHYSALFLPAEARRALLALYAFRDEMHDITAASAQAGVAEVKLGWWREEIGRTFAGRARHPVARALQPCIARRGLSAHSFHAILDSVAAEIGRSVYADAAELARSCQGSGGTIAALAARSTGGAETMGAAPAEAWALRLGTLLEHADRLLRCGEYLQRGRLALPLDVLARRGVDPAELLHGARGDGAAGENSGRPCGPIVEELLAEEAARVRNRLGGTMDELAAGDRYPQRAALTMARIQSAALRRVERAGALPLRAPVSIAPLRKLWIAWHTEAVTRRGSPARAGTGDAG